MTNKIGLFFGTFNPIHTGHMVVASVMLETTDIEKIRFVVSPQNPFKTQSDLLDESDRLEMVRSAVNENDGMEVSDIEFHLPKPSYTYDTLTRIQDEDKNSKFVLIIGEDNLQDFGKWKNSELIISSFDLYVYPRTSSLDSDFMNHKNITMVEAPKMDISSSFIRDFITTGKSIRFLVPEPVEKIISESKYYLE